MQRTDFRFQKYYPLVAASLLAFFIGSLVFLLVQFSNKVTYYFTPSILASKNFQNSASHLNNHLSSAQVQINPHDQTIVHFKDAFEQLSQTMLAYQDHGEYFDQEILTKSQLLIDQVENQEVKVLINLLKTIQKLSKINHEQHVTELEDAKTRISIFASLLGGLSIVVLIFGVIATRKEFKSIELQRRAEIAFSVIHSLIGALEARDKYTQGHSSRVAELSRSIAKTLGLMDETAEEIYFAGLMHDIGKIGVRDNVLLKPGKLTAEEYNEIKNHPSIGKKLVENQKTLNVFLPGILYHHERWDGKGYPDGLKGDEIPLMAQILSIADAYDAMTSTRPYRTSMPHEKAMKEIMENKGIQWSDKMVSALFATDLEKAG